MCIIAYKPKEARLSDETMMNCFVSNSDGAGFLVHDEETNTLICKKGFFSLNELKEAFEPYQGHKAVVHFRIGTHGKKDLNNCHPFLVTENLGFVHNGVIGIRRDIYDCSDTWHFNLYLQSFLADNPDAWATDRLASHLKEIDHALGWSKLVFMDNEGNVYIHDEKGGTWDEGCWFSNHCYKSWSGWGSGNWRAVKSFTKPHTDTVASVEGVDKATAVDSELIHPIVACTRCEVEYREYYNNWYEECNEFICDGCATALSDTDKVMSFGRTASSIGSTDYVSKIVEEFRNEKTDYPEVAIEACDACGEADESYFYVDKEFMWLCQGCQEAWHTLSEEEKINRVCPVN